MNEEKTFLSIKEAVKVTGLSEFSLRRMLANREIAFIECGNKYMIHRMKLLEHLEAACLKNQRR